MMRRRTLAWPICKRWKTSFRPSVAPGTPRKTGAKLRKASSRTLRFPSVMFPLNDSRLGYPTDRSRKDGGGFPDSSSVNYINNVNMLGRLRKDGRLGTGSHTSVVELTHCRAGGCSAW